MRYPTTPYLVIICRVEPRSHYGTIDDLREADQTRPILRGVQGPTELINMRHLYLIKCQAVDVLHVGWLGEGAGHVNSWNSVGQDCYSYISPHDKRVVDHRPISIKSPSCISRKPRGLSRSGKFKSHEWRILILFFSPVFEECIPQSYQYVNHLALLSHGMHFFSQNSISQDDLDTAKRVLTGYTELFEKYFTVDHVTFNPHLMCNHLLESAENLGPPWVYNMVGFES